MAALALGCAACMTTHLSRWWKNLLDHHVALCHILSGVNVAIHLPERGGMREVHMTPNQFGEGGFIACLGVAS